MRQITEQLNQAQTNQHFQEVSKNPIELIANYVKKNDYDGLLQTFGPKVDFDLNGYRYPGNESLIQESLSMSKNWDIFLWLYNNGAKLEPFYSDRPIAGYHLLSQRVGKYNDPLALDFLNTLQMDNDPKKQREAKIYLARAWAISMMQDNASKMQQQYLSNCVELISDANFYWRMVFNLSHIDSNQRFIWGIIGLHPKFVQFANTENDFEQIQKRGMDHLCTAARHGNADAIHLLKTQYVNDPEFNLTALSNIITAYIRKSEFSMARQWIEKLNAFADPNKAVEIIEVYQQILSNLSVIDSPEAFGCQWIAFENFNKRYHTNLEPISSNDAYMQMAKNLSQFNHKLTSDSKLQSDITNAWHQNAKKNLKTQTITFLQGNGKYNKLGISLNIALKALPNDANIQHIVDSLMDTLQRFLQFDPLTDKETIYLQKIVFITQQGPSLKSDIEQSSKTVRLKFGKTKKNTAAVTPGASSTESSKENTKLEPVTLQFKLTEIFKSNQNDAPKENIQAFYDAQL